MTWMNVSLQRRHEKTLNIIFLFWFFFVFLCRQGGKDQTKKGPNVKLGQGDKKGLGQDPRKDGSMDGGHHLKVCCYSRRI